MYEVSGSKPRTASDRGLVESSIETPVIGLAIEIIRPLLLHPLEVDTPANQLQQHNQRRPRHRFSPQIRNVLRRVDFRWLYSEVNQTIAHPGDVNRLRFAHVLKSSTVP